MKVRWREHEMIFVSLVAAIALAAYLWAMHNVSPRQFEDPFINNHVPFNFWRNVLLPDLARGLLIYLSYLFLNLFTIPRLLFPKKFEAGSLKISISLKKISLEGIAGKVLKKYLWFIIQILLITFLFGSALTVATYYEHEWQFHYPGFSFFPKNGNNPNSQIDIFASYAAVLFIIALYALWVAVREVIL